MATPFFEDILQQPAALRDLIHDYRSGEGRDRLQALQRPTRILLSGMGASYHAALYGALLFAGRGIAAVAVEATDLLNFNGLLLDTFDTLIFISQSGASGEILPLVERIPPTTTLIAITNHADSPLARAAGHTLLQYAGTETTVATKTYVNTLACLWTLAQHWDAADPFDPLSRLADSAQALVDGRDALITAWFDTLHDREEIVFLGHGPHHATARQAAMMLAEWAKYVALCFGIGAFRHGFIEIVTPRTGAVVFGAGGRTSTSTRGLISELESYGARTLTISGGQFGSDPADDFLAPLLDVIPAQFFAEFMAQHRKIEPGFRYIQKVVRRL